MYMYFYWCVPRHVQYHTSCNSFIDFISLYVTLGFCQFLMIVGPHEPHGPRTHADGRKHASMGGIDGWTDRSTHGSDRRIERTYEMEGRIGQTGIRTVGQTDQTD